MLRVLSLKASPDRTPGRAGEGVLRPKAESGAQRVPPKPSAEAVRRSQKLAADRAAAQRESDARAKALHAQIFKGGAVEQPAAAPRDEVDDSLAGIQEMEAERVRTEAANDQLWAEEQAKLFKAYGEPPQDDVEKALAGLQEMEAERVKDLDEAELVDWDDVEEHAPESPVVEAAVEKPAEARPGVKTQVLKAYKASIPEIPVNLPESEREQQLESLREHFKKDTESVYQQMSVLQEKLDKAPAGQAASLENQLVALHGQADELTKKEFYADHADPHQAEQYYEALAQRKQALQTSEGRGVLAKLNEMRGEEGWRQAQYITPEMIDSLDDGAERNLGRAWHALERDQMMLENGITQIKGERAAKENVNQLQIDLIRHLGTKLGVPSNVVEASRLPNVNRGDLANVADRILADLGKFDVPQDLPERLWSAALAVGLPIAKALGWKSLFGRKRANAYVNELQFAQDHYKDISTARAARSGPQLVLGSGSPGFMIATDFGSAFGRGSSESGVMLSPKNRESAQAITLEQSEDLQGILTEARHMTEALKRNPDSQSVLDSANDLAAVLQNRVLTYVDQPAARSRAYELANAQLQDLERAISDRATEDVDIDLDEAFGPITEKPSEKSPVTDSEEALTEELASDEMKNLDVALERSPDRLSDAQLEKIDHATEMLSKSQEELRSALANGEPLGKLFVDALAHFAGKRQRTLELLRLNRLGNNPAAQDLAEAIQDTRALLTEHSFLQADPAAYSAVTEALTEVKDLGAELANPSQLIDVRRSAPRLDNLRKIVNEQRGKKVAGSDAYDELQDAVRRLNEEMNRFVEEADLPAVGMGNERNSRFDEAITGLDALAEEIKTENGNLLRAPVRKDAAVLARQGAKYRRTLITTGRMLGKTPASMQGTARFQEAQQAHRDAEALYKTWAARNNQRYVTDDKA